MGSSSSKRQNMEDSDPGLEVVPFPDVKDLRGPLRNGYFLRPKSRTITAIWYKYDIEKKSWFWTPYYDFKIWMSVIDLKVVTGKWKGALPVKQNRIIIEKLQNKSMFFKM